MPGSIIVAALFNTTVAAFTIGQTILAFAINMIASSILSRVFAPDAPTFDGTRYPNPGNRQQVPPATDNKLPVVYGSAFVGGTIVDLSITNNNQQIYYVMALSEVTNSEYGNTGDVFSFGDVYWGGKKVIFSTTVGETYKVTGLLDESSGLLDTSVAGLIEFYFYRNGSNTPTNSALSAITVMSNPNLSYQWDATKLMSNCAFVIIKLTYSSDANITGMQQTKFQVINPRANPGDCFLDYFRSTRYGAALQLANIDTTSLTALNTYCSQVTTFTPYTGGTNSIIRFRFDGVLLTDQFIMSNIQMMANCCDCLIKYNEITSKWGVIIQQPTYSTSLQIDDSNLIGAISVSPLDISNTFNIAEVKFVDSSEQDTFASAIFDLAQVAPALLYPNEPVNKQTITLPLVNNNVRAQILANRFLKSCREDLQVQCVINYVGIQLEAGDIVELTNQNYGFANKLFRVQKVTENFADDGSVTASLMITEFNPAVFDDANVTQFTPAPNSGFLDPTIFGDVPAPVISGIVNSGFKPKFDVVPTTSSSGIIEVLEIWYSTVANPTTSQLNILTTYVSTNGQGFDPNTTLDAFEIATFEAGTYYFFVRVGNSLKISLFSSGTEIIWNPTYIDDVTGATGNGINLQWNPVANWRLAGYKIRYQYGANTDWGTASPLFSGLVTDTVYAATGLTALIVTVLIKAVDTEGHESVNAAAINLNVSNTNLVANVIDVIDFKADGWLGDKVNCSVIGGDLVADLNTSFYGEDEQSFYHGDTESFYDADVYKALTYTTLETYISNALAGSVGVLYWTAEGNNPIVEYRQVNAPSFYGADNDSKYGIDPNASFYGGGDTPFLPMPSSIVVQNGYYQFRISLGTGAVGKVTQFNFAVDAPDVIEVLPNYVVTGGAIAYTKNFTSITNVQATLQQNGVGVVTLRVDKTNPLAPTITGYNSSQIATSGATADITLQGY